MSKRILTATIILSLVFILGGSEISALTGGLSHASAAASPKTAPGSKWQMNHERITETGNVKTVTAANSSLPDLVIENITWSPPYPSVGDIITFTVTIKNQGSGRAGSSNVAYYIDNTYLTSAPVDPIDAGATATKTFVWTAQVGSHAVKAIADANEKVAETDETNNVTAFHFSTLAPDLIIQAITWSPAEPSKGDRVIFTVTIKNQGSGRAGSSRVYFYIDDTTRGYEEVQALDAGATITKIFTWTARAGSHTIKAVADRENLVTENDETNNVKTVTFLTAAPDLIVQNITWTPTSPSSGDNVTFKVTIKNQGKGKAGSSNVASYIDNTYLTSAPVDPIDAGATANTTFSWFAKAGSHTIEVVADPNESVLESDETNNVKTVTFLTAAPDLIVQNITWTPTSPSTGDTVTFTVTIKNQGKGKAGSSRVYSSVDGVFRGYQDVKALDAGVTTTTTFTWTAQAGSHTIKAIADFYEWVTENDETNNVKTVTFSGTILSDLIIQDIIWSPAEPSIGDTVTFTVTIKNQGSGRADSSRVAYYIDNTYLTSVLVSRIAAGATANKTFTRTAQVGSHAVKAVADFSKWVAETDETNNAKTVAFSTIAPDLVVQNITWTPTSPSSGDNVTFTVTIKNQGNDRSGPSNVAYFIDGSSRGYHYVEEIDVGATVAKTFTWTVQAGSHTFEVIIDPDKKITENDETNNERTVTFPAPDFTVPNITWSPINPLAGDNVTFTVTMENQGEGKAGSSRIYFYIDGSSQDYQDVEEIDAGTRATKTFTWTAQAGSHTIKAIADGENFVTESDETNNEKTVTFSISPPPAPAPAPPPAAKPTPVPPPSPKPPEVNINLEVQNPHIPVGQNIVLNLSASNLVTEPTMTVQLDLKLPPGMSMTSAEFAKSGVGQYTARYSVKPGDTQQTRVLIRANQEGSFSINAHLTYYFAGDKSTAESRTLSLPVTVITAEATPEKPIPSPERGIWPGWWLILAAVVLGGIVVIATMKAW